jgi:cell division protein ZapE
MTAYVPQEEIYTSGSLMFEFERTKSRLIEMASLEFMTSVKDK